MEYQLKMKVNQIKVEKNEAPVIVGFQIVKEL